MADQTLLIDPHQLAQELEVGADDLVVLDVRVHYVDGEPVPHRSAYEEGHLPGALFVDLVGELSDPHDRLQFTLPSAVRFSRAVGALGVGDESRVVVYTDGWQIWATRLWWLFRYFGFDRVRVLNGNFRSWAAAGLPVSQEIPSPVPAEFTARPRQELVIDEREVERISSGEAPGLLVNALPYELFTGEVPTHGTTAGRIPASANIPWPVAADLDSGRFADPQEIERAAAPVLSAAGEGGPVAAYCGAGVSATGLIFGLALIGRDDIRLYDGSLDSWVLGGRRGLERGEPGA
ncbi:sulfurtransferase [Leucobacter weissii]|uniref:Sulfurtransferase n=1 Tax=Leucobacter weissii TaxID=1983706 RepID=A0A939MQ28_9MICO|nr:rhodanese-like domain-containing protein [Leucobacter weissii]MBO1900964.1 sulfurtransferase [Leucobacter weissii]